MKTRRKFITDSWKWSGLIFVPRLLRAQPVFPPAFWGPATASGGGGGGGGTEFISATSGGFESNISGLVGFKVTMGSGITVIALGMFAAAGDTDSSKSVAIYDAACALIVSTSVDISAHDDAYHYNVISQALSASTTYFIAFNNVNSQAFTANAAATHSAVATVPQDVWAGSSGNCSTLLGSADHISKGPNFKYI
jgi:hypothetical protein